MRERERDTETDRSHCRAKIGNEFTLSLAKIRTIGEEYQVANAITTMWLSQDRQPLHWRLSVKGLRQ